MVEVAANKHAKGGIIKKKLLFHKVRGVIRENIAIEKIFDFDFDFEDEITSHKINKKIKK